MNTNVSQFMNREVYTINPFSSVSSAQNILESNKIGGLPVVEDKKVIGIITSYDVRRSHPNRLVIDAMTKNPISVSGNENTIYALKILEDNKIERLPVVNEHNELIGLITKGVLLKEAGKRIDSLTGLQSSQTIIWNIEKLLKNNDDIVCLFFDLNEFGVFNKKYGHIIGDEIIRKISEILKMFIEEDWLCRFGGDEFVAILPSNIENANRIARNIIAYIISDNYLKEMNVSVAIGISGGRRKFVRNDDNEITKNIKNLINLASLSNTKAKSFKNDVLVANELTIV